MRIQPDTAISALQSIEQARVNDNVTITISLLDWGIRLSLACARTLNLNRRAPIA
jgi:hypothetical protein